MSDEIEIPEEIEDEKFPEILSDIETESMMDDATLNSLIDDQKPPEEIMDEIENLPEVTKDDDQVLNMQKHPIKVTNITTDDDIIEDIMPDDGDTDIIDNLNMDSDEILDDFSDDEKSVNILNFGKPLDELRVVNRTSTVLSKPENKGTNLSNYGQRVSLPMIEDTVSFILPVDQKNVSNRIKEEPILENESFQSDGSKRKNPSQDENLSIHGSIKAKIHKRQHLNVSRNTDRNESLNDDNISYDRYSIDDDEELLQGILTDNQNLPTAVVDKIITALPDILPAKNRLEQSNTISDDNNVHSTLGDNDIQPPIVIDDTSTNFFTDDNKPINEIDHDINLPDDQQAPDIQNIDRQATTVHPDTSTNSFSNDAKETKLPINNDQPITNTKPTAENMSYNDRNRRSVMSNEHNRTRESLFVIDEEPHEQIPKPISDNNNSDQLLTQDHKAEESLMISRENTTSTLANDKRERINNPNIRGLEVPISSSTPTFTPLIPLANIINPGLVTAPSGHTHKTDTNITNNNTLNKSTANNSTLQLLANDESTPGIIPDNTVIDYETEKNTTVNSSKVLSPIPTDKNEISFAKEEIPEILPMDNGQIENDMIHVDERKTTATPDTKLRINDTNASKLMDHSKDDINVTTDIGNVTGLLAEYGNVTGNLFENDDMDITLNTTKNDDKVNLDNERTNNTMVKDAEVTRPISTDDGHIQDGIMHVDEPKITTTPNETFNVSTVNNDASHAEKLENISVNDEQIPERLDDNDVNITTDVGNVTDLLFEYGNATGSLFGNDNMDITLNTTKNDDVVDKQQKDNTMVKDAKIASPVPTDDGQTEEQVIMHVDEPKTTSAPDEKLNVSTVNDAAKLENVSINDNKLSKTLDNDDANVTIDVGNVTGLLAEYAYATDSLFDNDDSLITDNEKRDNTMVKDVKVVSPVPIDNEQIEEQVITHVDRSKTTTPDELFDVPTVDNDTNDVEKIENVSSHDNKLLETSSNNDNAGKILDYNNDERKVTDDFFDDDQRKENTNVIDAIVPSLITIPKVIIPPVTAPSPTILTAASKPVGKAMAFEERTETTTPTNQNESGMISDDEKSNMSSMDIDTDAKTLETIKDNDNEEIDMTDPKIKSDALSDEKHTKSPINDENMNKSISNKSTEDDMLNMSTDIENSVNISVSEDIEKSSTPVASKEDKVLTTKMMNNQSVNKSKNKNRKGGTVLRDQERLSTNDIRNSTLKDESITTGMIDASAAERSVNPARAANKKPKITNKTSKNTLAVGDEITADREVPLKVDNKQGRTSNVSTSKTNISNKNLQHTVIDMNTVKTVSPNDRKSATGKSDEGNVTNSYIQAEESVSFEGKLNMTKSDVSIQGINNYSSIDELSVENEIMRGLSLNGRKSAILLTGRKANQPSFLESAHVIQVNSTKESHMRALPSEKFWRRNQRRVSTMQAIEDAKLAKIAAKGAGMATWKKAALIAAVAALILIGVVVGVVVGIILKPSSATTTESTTVIVPPTNPGNGNRSTTTTTTVTNSTTKGPPVTATSTNSTLTTTTPGSLTTGGVLQVTTQQEATTAPIIVPITSQSIVATSVVIEATTVPSETSTKTTIAEITTVNVQTTILPAETSSTTKQTTTLSKETTTAVVPQQSTAAAEVTTASMETVSSSTKSSTISSSTSLGVTSSSTAATSANQIVSAESTAMTTKTSSITNPEITTAQEITTMMSDVVKTSSVGQVVTEVTSKSSTVAEVTSAIAEVSTATPSRTTNVVEYSTAVTEMTSKSTTISEGATNVQESTEPAITAEAITSMSITQSKAPTAAVYSTNIAETTMVPQAISTVAQTSAAAVIQTSAVATSTSTIKLTTAGIATLSQSIIPVVPTSMALSESSTTTTIKSETTNPEITTAALQESTANIEATTTLKEIAATTAVEVTTQLQKTSAAASERLTTAADITTEPVQVTTAPVQVTTAPAQVTTAPAQATTAPAQVTTAPAPAQVTSASVQATTAAVKVTTTPANPTTSESTAILQVTTALPEPVTTSSKNPLITSQGETTIIAVTTAQPEVTTVLAEQSTIVPAATTKTTTVSGEQSTIITDALTTAKTTKVTTAIAEQSTIITATLTTPKTTKVTTQMIEVLTTNGEMTTLAAETSTTTLAISTAMPAQTTLPESFTSAVKSTSVTTQMMIISSANQITSRGLLTTAEPIIATMMPTTIIPPVVITVAEISTKIREATTVVPVTIVPTVQVINTTPESVTSSQFTTS